MYEKKANSTLVSVRYTCFKAKIGVPHTLVQWVLNRLFVGETSHVETVVLLSKKNVKPKDYVEIGVDIEDYYKIKEGK